MTQRWLAVVWFVGSRVIQTRAGVDSWRMHPPKLHQKMPEVPALAPASSIEAPGQVSTPGPTTTGIRKANQVSARAPPTSGATEDKLKRPPAASATAQPAPPEFRGPFDVLPPGYALGEKVVSMVDRNNRSDPTQYVHRGDVGRLWYPNPDAKDSSKPFLVTFPNFQQVAMRDSEFAVQPIHSKCSGLPPYPKIRSHAICFSPKGGPYRWHSMWEASYAIPSVGGCSAVKMDCADQNRVQRILHKYRWIARQTGRYGPELRRHDLNVYAFCCVQEQCLGGTSCGRVPVVTSPSRRLYHLEGVQVTPPGQVFAGHFVV